MGRCSCGTLFKIVVSPLRSCLFPNQARYLETSAGRTKGTATLTATQPYFSRHQRSPCLDVPLRNWYQHLRNPDADNGCDRNARKERESVDIRARARSAKVGERRDRRHSLCLSLSVSLYVRLFLVLSFPPLSVLDVFNCSRMLNCIVAL